MSRVTLTADDFGLSEAVNEAVERAHRDGVLTSASLMVAAPAAADAIARARRMPSLKVGLHLVVIEGRAILPPEQIPALVNASGWFPSDQLRLGLRYFFLPHVRRQLKAEITAQFAAFAATGLPLAHADAHKHMHLHPTVARLLIAAGRRHGLRRVRVPAEPPEIMARLGTPTGHALYRWSRLLRAQLRHAGLSAPDAVFGLAWSGAMTTDRVRRLLDILPKGDIELFFHPATRRDALLDTLMPAYDHQGELAALLDPGIRAALKAIR